MLTTDQITKQTTFNAPIERVWNAITDTAKFGRWFGITFPDGAAFAPNVPIGGILTRACGGPDYAGTAFAFHIERIEPMTLFSYRWHPFAVGTGADLSSEPMTLVEFTLAPFAGGTKLTIVESGFDNIPLKRRAAAFEANSGGWDTQTENLTGYLAAHAS